MKWIKLLMVLAGLGGMYYLFMMIRMGKGLDVFVIGFVIFLLIIIFSYYNYIKDRYAI